MRRVVAGTVALLVMGQAVGLAQAQRRSVEIHDGFLTAEQYRALPQDSRDAWAAGIVEGIFLAPFFGAPKARMKWLEACLTGMTHTQVTAILMKYINQHPERWHEQVHTTMYSALLDACPKPQP